MTVNGKDALDVANLVLGTEAAKQAIVGGSAAVGGAAANLIGGVAGGTAVATVSSVGTATAGFLAGVTGPGATIAGTLAICNPVALGAITLGFGALAVGALFETIFD